MDSQTVLNVESSTVTGSSDSVTITIKATNEYLAPVIKSDAVDVKGALTEVTTLALKIETSLSQHSI